MTHSKKIGFWNYVAYGAGDLYGGGAFFIVTTFAMYYFVNVVGMHPVLAGLIPAIGKIWDAVSDPMMGYISDHTPQNRFGKRRVWFLVSIVPIAVSFALIWFPTSIATQAGKFAFYTFAYIFFFTVATISYVPYAALSAEMTRDSKERNFLNGTRILFSFISTLLAGVIAKPVIGLFADEKTGYFVMGIIFSLIFALPWITLYLGTWELPELQRSAKQKKSFFANFFSLFRNRSCRIHILMYVGSYGTLDILMSWFMFYLVDYLDREAWFVIAQGALLLTMIGMLPVYVKIANKKGHAAAYLIGLSLFVAGMIFMSFQTPQTPVAFLIANVILLGAGISAGCLIPHALLPFVSDIDRLISGEERAGTYSAAMTLTRKLFLGLIIMTGLGVLLAQIGYRNPVPYELPEIQYSEAFAEIQSRTNAVDTAYVFDKDARIYRLDKNHKDASVAEETVKTGAALLNRTLEDSKNIAESVFNEISAAAGADLKARGERIAASYLYLPETQSYRLILTDDETPDVQAAQNERLRTLRGDLDFLDFQYIGYGNPVKPKQTESTLARLKFFFILLPTLMSVIGLIAASFFRVTPKNHGIIRKELDRLSGGGSKADVDPEVKKVCEKLTGLPYESLYPDA